MTLLRRRIAAMTLAAATALATGMALGSSAAWADTLPLPELHLAPAAMDGYPVHSCSLAGWYSGTQLFLLYTGHVGDPTKVRYVWGFGPTPIGLQDGIPTPVPAPAEPGNVHWVQDTPEMKRHLDQILACATTPVSPPPSEPGTTVPPTTEAPTTSTSAPEPTPTTAPPAVTVPEPGDPTPESEPPPTTGVEVTTPAEASSDQVQILTSRTDLPATGTNGNRAAWAALAIAGGAALVTAGRRLRNKEGR